MSNTVYGLLDRMHHAASHCETLYDAEWEAQQLRDAAAEAAPLQQESAV